MKKFQLFISLFALISLFFMACEPMEESRPDIGQAPTEDQLGISISPGSDQFHFVITNTSSVVGNALWDFGNGSKGQGNEVEVRYPIAGTYTVKLTLVTKGGTTSITTELEQTETDFSVFTDPVYVNLSGGVDLLEGKTWVLDSLQRGHIGVGDASKTDDLDIGLGWWAAGPVEKTGCFMYDDEINFNINQFVATYINHNKSYVKGYRTSDPAYSNPVSNNGDYNVDYPSPAPGVWSISEINGEYFLTLSGATPIVPCFDVGAKDNTYKIVSVTENLLELNCFSANESWTKWHYYLIPKGYVKPKITFDVDIQETANPNEYAMQLTNVNIPTGLSISKVVWNSGDATLTPIQITNYSQVVNFTYMQANTYTVQVTVTDNNGDTYIKTQNVVVAQDHPDYVPYVEANMAMYSNYDNIFSKTEIDKAGGDASFTLIANPLKNLTNESNFCIKFTKVNNQWANVYTRLSTGYRFDLDAGNTFKLLVYGTAGDVILLKLENTDLGGNAWTTGTPDRTYTIQESNTWEVAEFDIAPANPSYTTGYYNVVRVMLNAGNGSGTFNVYIDDWAGPAISGWKK